MSIFDLIKQGLCDAIEYHHEDKSKGILSTLVVPANKSGECQWNDQEHGDVHKQGGGLKEGDL